MGIYNIPINEVYFGNTPDIQEAQKYLSLLRKEIIKNDTLFVKTASSNKNLYKFNRQIEKIFGFKTFSLVIIYSDELNAFTIPLSMHVDVHNPSKKFKPNKSTMKFDTEAEFNCMTFIYTGLFLDERFSDREIMAILLHEIGHNFSSSLDSDILLFNSIKKSIYVLKTLSDIILQSNDLIQLTTNTVGFALNNSNKVSGIVERNIQKILKDNKSIAIFIDSYTSAINKLLSLISNFNLLSVIISLNPILILINILRNVLVSLNPLNFINVIMCFNDERVADNFVTMYGYGDELSSALLKFEFKNKNRKSTILELIRESVMLPVEILLAPLDEHPENVSRAASQIDYLKKELQDSNLDPKMKKEITKQIKNIENDLTDALEIDTNKLDHQKFRKLYKAHLYRLCGGDLRNNVFEDNNYEKIKNSYDQKIQNVKIK